MAGSFVARRAARPTGAASCRSRCSRSSAGRRLASSGASTSGRRSAGSPTCSAFTLLGLYVALMRDTIQIVRAVRRRAAGRARWLSLVIEIFSGLLIDAPIPLLSRRRDSSAAGGPISGIVATRNQLGLLAIVGAISFADRAPHALGAAPDVGRLPRARRRSASLFTQSPVVLGTALVVGVAAAVLYGLRRVPRRPAAALAARSCSGSPWSRRSLAWLLRTADRRDLQRGRRPHLPPRALEQDLRPRAASTSCRAGAGSGAGTPRSSRSRR